ncbi:MAG: dephospho-CoA kinase [Candidatus Pacebacteria bacterium]|nr:dephospho-CoA kinase [Candidatus Paceibacterota bacterium]MBP9851136.1 dephospho-CoA kinase [Candidatus Paceibacterota bacterium]
MRAFAITGNIGSGKSTVAKFLEKLGAVIISCDNVAKEIAASGLYQNEINLILGENVFPEGCIDFKTIRNIVFSNKTILLAYEQFIHPLVWAKVEELVAESAGKLCVVENALIYQKSDQWRFDYGVIVAICSPKEQFARLIDPARRNMQAEDAIARIKLQYQSPESHPATRFVIDTEYEIEELEKRVLGLYQELTKYEGV